MPRSEGAAESATSVDNCEATHADFQQNLLEQKASKFVSVDVMGGHADDKLSEVTHGG